MDLIDKLKPIHKTWITFLSMVVLAMSQITKPINLKAMLPSFMTQPIVMEMTAIDFVAIIVLLSAIFWVAGHKTA
jgi:hypothetical protein